MVKPVKFKVGRGKQEDLPIRYVNGFVWFTTDTGKLYIDAPVNGTLERTLINPDVDWSQISNKPDEIVSIYYNTVEGWNQQRDLIAQKDALYIYTDASQIDGKNVPAIKIGDGTSYLIDAPFLVSTTTDEMNAHIRNTAIHVSSEDRDRWDNKVRTYYSKVQEETLVFTTD